MIGNDFTFFMPLNFMRFYKESDLAMRWEYLSFKRKIKFKLQIFLTRGRVVDNWNEEELINAYESLYIPGTKKGVFNYPHMYEGIEGKTWTEKSPQNIWNYAIVL